MSKHNGMNKGRSEKTIKTKRTETKLKHVEDTMLASPFVGKPLIAKSSALLRTLPISVIDSADYRYLHSELILDSDVQGDAFIYDEEALKKQDYEQLCKTALQIGRATRKKYQKEYKEHGRLGQGRHVVAVFPVTHIKKHDHLVVLRPGFFYFLSDAVWRFYVFFLNERSKHGFPGNKELAAEFRRFECMLQISQLKFALFEEDAGHSDSEPRSLVEINDAIKTRGFLLTYYGVPLRCRHAALGASSIRVDERFKMNEDSEEYSEACLELKDDESELKFFKEKQRRRHPYAHIAVRQKTCWRPVRSRTGKGVGKTKKHDACVVHSMATLVRNMTDQLICKDNFVCKEDLQQMECPECAIGASKHIECPLCYFADLKYTEIASGPSGWLDSHCWADGKQDILHKGFRFVFCFVCSLVFNVVLRLASDIWLQFT